MDCGKVFLRLPLGGDDEVVVKVAWEGPESQRAPGSRWRVFDGVSTVLRKALTAAEGGSEVGTHTVEWAGCVVILRFRGRPGF